MRSTTTKIIYALIEFKYYVLHNATPSQSKKKITFFSINRLHVIDIYNWGKKRRFQTGLSMIIRFCFFYR